MSLSGSAPDSSTREPWNVPLAPTKSIVARARSHIVREIANLALPRSVLFARSPRDRSRKRIALTFDDGPDRMTVRYLDILARLGVRATFFLVGENVARAPDLASEYLRRGHEVGGHGWSHEPFSTMTNERLAEELERTDALLPSPPSGARRLVRPPRGELSLRALVRIAAAGYTTVMWSVDSDDSRTRDPRAIERRMAPGNVLPGDIVLLHELQPWTLDALPSVIGALRARGLEPVTVSELMGAARL
jgi:peptidoglycan-N-acetylglucosamine deacetylase